MVEIFSSLQAGHVKTAESGIGGVGGFIGKMAKGTWNGLSKAANGIAYGIGRAGMKWPLIIAGSAAAVGGLAIWANSSRKDAEKESRQAVQAANITAAQPMDVGANTMMGMQPVEGAFAQRVKAARGGAQGVDASNPNLSMGGNVQNL